MNSSNFIHDMKIRLAAPDDAAPVLDIYGPYIKGTSLTFETEVPTVDQFRKKIQGYLEEWPWLVCETDDGLVAGYAYASRYRERAGYQWCVEVSVYIQERFHHCGIGSALYGVLFKVLKIQGYRNVYAVINLPNDASVKFHERLGFEFFALYKNVGYKRGAWKNVGWWQKILNDHVHEPAPPVKFSRLNHSELNQLFESEAKKISGGQTPLE
jgi:L-amino acid N-acyltransferase YncA